MSDDVKQMKSERTLSEDELVSERAVGRRSALTAMGGVVLGAAAMTVLGAAGAESAEAQSDGDMGRYADGTARPPPPRPPPPRRRRSGVTDSDSGQGADPAGNGRGRRGSARSGCTDSDGGPNADPGGAGRRCAGGRRTGCSDSDGGPNADPGGAGRRCGGGARSCSDSDGGPSADPGGRGRRC